jgi:uncharacterized protein (DUF4415 family)
MTGRKPASRSDLEKVDARPIAPEQYDELPELTEEWFEKADLHVGGVKVGRPRSATRKVALKLRLDPDVVKAFRETGPGWQTRMNAALQRAASRFHVGKRGARTKARAKKRRTNTRTARARKRA